MYRPSIVGSAKAVAVRERLSVAAAATRESRRRVIRLGVVACVVVAVVAGATKFDDTLGVYDLRADQNSSFDYAERTYPSENALGSARVVEDARLWMPRNATYRVVVGPNPRTKEWRFARYFLLGFLFPRRQTESKSASWVFCYGCDASTLGERFRVLSDGGNGVLFGRMRP